MKTAVKTVTPSKMTYNEWINYIKEQVKLIKNK